MKAVEKGGTVAKATTWYLICDFILKGLSFITMPIFTRLMSVGEIGKYTSFASWVSLLSIVVTLNLIPSVILARFDFEDEYDEYVSTIAILGMASSAIFYLACLPFRSTISDFLGFDEYAFHLMFIYLIFCQVPGVLVAKYRAIMEYKKSVAISLTSAIIVTVVSIVCTVLFEDHLEGRLVGFCIPSTILNIIIFALFIFKKSSLKIKYCKYALAICLPLIVHNLAGNVMHTADRIMIERMDSAVSAGYYGVAYSCAMVANMLRNSINSAWEPFVYEQINQENTGAIKKGSYLLLLSFSFLCVGIILFAPEILLIVGGSAYLEAQYVVPPVVIAYMFSMVYSLYAGIEQYYKKQKFFAVVAIICASSNVALNFALIPQFGYVSAAYTTLFCLALECLLHYLNVRRMGLHHLYDTKFNVALLSFMLVFSFAALALYDYPILRYSVTALALIGAAIFAGLNKDRLKELTEKYRNEGKR